MHPAVQGRETVKEKSQLYDPADPRAYLLRAGELTENFEVFTPECLRRMAEDRPDLIQFDGHGITLRPGAPVTVRVVDDREDL
jgi:3-deoxy-D-arabino-heptulosonate 7-phosphate (DAHP) synthase class II